MSGKAAIVHSPELESYGFGEEHPFNPRRLRLALELCDALGLLDGYDFIEPEPAAEEDLQAVHSLNYIRRVQDAGNGETSLESLMHYGIGTPDNPVFPGMHDACAHVVGGTVRACELVMGGEATHAMNISGGLHHALRSRASGFCVYNDAAVAIARLKKQYPGIRVAYVDTDAHHGDGVQWMFYGDPEVLTISMHETGRYLFPGTGDTGELGRNAGRGYSLNVPLEPFTDDDSWIECFEAFVPEALRAFRPDLIVSQNGVDGHKLDPLTHLSATTRLYEHVPARMHELAHELCEGRWVAIGGGGYDHWRVVPRAWTFVWAAVSHQEVAERVPDEWVRAHQPQSPEALPTLMRDDPEKYPPIERAPEIAEKNRRAVEEVLERALPLMRQQS